MIVSALVLKLGGSLLENGRLEDVLARVGASERRIVVVPGGGPFADAVRDVQSALGLSDAAAHHLAILAMHQSAHVMVALQPRLLAVETLTDIRRAWRSGHIPIWLPLKLALRDPTLPADWSLTSDGLAARLAVRLGGLPVALVKSCRVPQVRSVEELAAAGIVDSVFADIVIRAGLAWHVLGKGQGRELDELLATTVPRSRRGR